MTGISGGSPIRADITQATEKADAASSLQLKSAQQESSQEAAQADMADANPFAAGLAARNSKDLGKVAEHIKTGKAAQKEDKGLSETAILPLDQIKDSASNFKRRNPELKMDDLVKDLKAKLKPDSKADDILNALKDFYKGDAALEDEALDFLLENTQGDLKAEVEGAKSRLNQEEGPAIRAGRNMGEISRQGEKAGLGSAASLRDMYRDITNNPRDTPTLFDELAKKYPYKELGKVAKMLLHSAGADLKGPNGPSIEPGKLSATMATIRSVQAVLGVYKFFKASMPLTEKGLAHVQSNRGVGG